MKTKSVLSGLAIGALALSLVLPNFRTVQAQMRMNMPGMPNSNDLVPPALGYAKGQSVFFIHPEASDPGVAETLTKMMGPKVFTVRSLAQIPDRLLGDVYVFTNGVKGDGPLGFQPDVFPNVPGDSGYTPLRRLNLVTWKSGVAARVLKSAPDVLAARSRGELTTKRPGVVVNMPMLTWSGGTR